MTLRLAIDDTDQSALPDGNIVAINPTLAGLQAALTSLGLTPGDYTADNQRVAEIDETDATKWNPLCEPNWKFVGGAVQEFFVTPLADKIAQDIDLFRSTFSDKEAVDLPALLAREHVDVSLDSGHTWVDDILHSWVKPWLRLVESKLATAKANPTQANIDAYATDLAKFLEQASSPGLLGFHATAIKSEWRPLRDGSIAYEYDSADGGIKAGTNRAVAYPTGTTVATWSAYAAIATL